MNQLKIHLFLILFMGILLPQLILSQANDIENGLSLGTYNLGNPDDTVQLLLSGKHNFGVNNGLSSTMATFKLKNRGL